MNERSLSDWGDASVGCRFTVDARSGFGYAREWLRGAPVSLVLLFRTSKWVRGWLELAQLLAKQQLDSEVGATPGGCVIRPNPAV